MTTVRVNLRNNSITQYGAYPFTSFCLFNNRPIGLGLDGIFTLDGELKDIYTEDVDEREVSAWFEYPISQFGLDNIKQGRRFYISGEFNGLMEIQVDTTGAIITTKNYTINPKNKNNLQHTIQIPLDSRQKAEYWKLTLSNISGSDFSIDSIDLVCINVTRRFGL